MPGPVESAAIGGHVNMMMDVLIAQLPPDDLRAASRRLLSEHPTLASELRDVVRRARLAVPAIFLQPDALQGDADAVISEVLRCTHDFRLDFLSGLYLRALHRMSGLISALHTASDGSELDTQLAVKTMIKQVEGDIIQCMQAIKETIIDASPDSVALKDGLHDLWSKLNDVKSTLGFQRACSQVWDAYVLLFPEASTPRSAPPSPAKWKLEGQDLKTTIPTIALGPIQMPRLMIGLWQLSSPAWGVASASELESSLLDLLRSGFRAADMADHYGDAEIIFGQFRKSLPRVLNDQLLTCTKWCVFAAPENVSAMSEWVAGKVHERRNRCGGQLDVLQFHWQDYSDKRYLPIVHHLVALSRFVPHVVRAIGLVNFDAERTDEICTYLKGTGDGRGIVISNQVQYSLIDQRPRFAMAGVCKKHGIKLLTYGTYCGGFLSDKWLGQPSPNLYADSITPSQRKYFDMIALWGGWTLFQELLLVLKHIADKHGEGIDIANVAAKWVLEKDEVASVIVGTRLGVSSNNESNLRVFTFELTTSDHAAINTVLEKSRIKEMFSEMGDCGAEYRHISH